MPMARPTMLASAIGELKTRTEPKRRRWFHQLGVELKEGVDALRASAVLMLSFAQLTLDSIAHADVNHPTVDPVPYTGIQYVDIPEFQELGTQVSQQIAAAIAGTTTVDNALQAAQQLAETVAKTYRK